MDRPLDIDEPLGQYYESRDGQYTHGQAIGHRRITRAVTTNILMDRTLGIDEPLGQYYESRDGQYTHGQTIGHRRAARSVLREP